MVSWMPPFSSIWPLILQQTSFPECVPVYTLTGMMAKVEAAKGLLSASLRSCTVSLLNLTGQNKSQGHPRLKRWENRLHLLLGGTAKSYCIEMWTQRSVIHEGY